jgi:hypothetical protein
MVKMFDICHANLLLWDCLPETLTLSSPALYHGGLTPAGCNPQHPIPTPSPAGSWKPEAQREFGKQEEGRGQGFFPFLSQGGIPGSCYLSPSLPVLTGSLLWLHLPLANPSP